jgi:putative tricarboxylic transport membrane protein
VFDIGVMIVFSVVGYAFRKLALPLAPAVMTFILGPLMEKSLRNSLEMSQGDFSILFQRPISATVLVIAACLFVMFVFLQLRGQQQTKLRTGQIEV